MSEKAVLFDIQRFAIHDGPGIRTTVFFKGCSNRCGWCHNPESLTMDQQIRYDPLRCIHCAACVEACLTGAQYMLGPLHKFDRMKCNGCMRCAAACNPRALTTAGYRATVDEVMEKVLEDMPYYRRSGGGVTLSGGEPVLQSEFCLALLKRLREMEIHTCLETAGNYPYARLEPLVPLLDLVLFDVKAVSKEIYDQHIHANPDTIFQTLTALSKSGVPIIARTPVVGGVNDTDEEITAIAQRVSGLQNIRNYKLIPYHALGKAKYDALGQAYEVPYYTPTKQRIEQLERIASEFVPVL